MRIGSVGKQIEDANLVQKRLSDTSAMVHIVAQAVVGSCRK